MSIAGVNFTRWLCRTRKQVLPPLSSSSPPSGALSGLGQQNNFTSTRCFEPPSTGFIAVQQRKLSGTAAKMADKSKKDVIRVGGFQMAPVYLNKQATIEKILRELDSKVRGQGLDLVAFSEAIIPGYPFHIDSERFQDFGIPLQMELQARLHKEAVRIADGDLVPIQNKARELGTSIVLGVVEADETRGNALFCTAVFIDGDTGDIKNAHRKLMPTYDERKCWSIGDGHGLKTMRVGGFKVSTLNCWENWMPLPRASLYGQGTEFHIAIWPGSDRLTEDITRFIAREGRIFCLSVGGVLRQEDITECVPQYQVVREGLAKVQAFFPAAGEWLTNGGSCLAGPNAQWMQEPILGGERLFVHELDLNDVRRHRLLMDVGGHYARPDVFNFSFNADRPANVVRVESDKEIK